MREALEEKNEKEKTEERREAGEREKERKREKFNERRERNLIKYFFSAHSFRYASTAAACIFVFWWS